MPPRLPALPRPSGLLALPAIPSASTRLYASAAATSLYTPAAADAVKTLYPSTQPPSHRAAAARKTQLHRNYLSLLRSTPLMLLFQHNNCRATEWAALRRELSNALAKLPLGAADPITPHVKITILRNGIFDAALRVSDYYDPSNKRRHGTSSQAFHSAKWRGKNHPLKALMSGPLGCVTFPEVSPEHLKVVMDLMFPDGKPMKGLDPQAVQGMQKLILLAARVDGHAAGNMGKAEVMDREKIKWVSVLPGYEGLRGQLVAALQTMGGGELVRSLESIPVGVVRTLDGHRKNIAGELEPKEGEGEAKSE